MRVTGVLRARFVEFDFALDEDLEVELVMPYAEFREFCDEHHATVLPAQGEVALEMMQLSTQATNGSDAPTKEHP